LSVSYGIIERHGGKITVESRLGNGTTFTITLPSQTLTHISEPPPAAKSTKKNLKVLVVDDEEFVRDALIEMVSELASEVVGAENGRQALQLLKSHQFDIVFTDLSMPEMDGWDLAREIGQNWSSTKTVLVTGYGKGIAVPPDKREFVHSVIGKPFSFEQLSQTLEKIKA
jgi:CheY-like chemotaxis protein